MHRLSRHAGRFAIAAALLLCAGTVWLRGQDDDDDLVKVRDEAAAKRQNPFVAGGRIMITEHNVDSWIYGRESRPRMARGLSQAENRRNGQGQRTFRLAETEADPGGQG